MGALLVVGGIIIYNIINQGTALNFTQMKSLIENGYYFTAAGEKSASYKIDEVIFDAYQWTVITDKGIKFYAIGPSMYSADGFAFITQVTEGYNKVVGLNPDGQPIYQWIAPLPTPTQAAFGRVFFPSWAFCL